MRGIWFAGQMIGIAAAVLVLVVRADHGKDVAEGFQRGADLLADEGVRLHDAALLRAERTGLEQDLIRHGHLADVVNHAAALQSEALVLGQTELLGKRGRVARDAFAMPGGVGVLGLDAAGQGTGARFRPFRVRRRCV